MSEMNADEKTVILHAFEAVRNRLHASNPRAIIHGYTDTGEIDVEFPVMMHAVRWIISEGLDAHADFRDPKRLADCGVITFNLYDYAKLRWRRGETIMGTIGHFREKFGDTR